MAFEQKDNSGALFKNDKEGGNPNWPDYKGKVMVAGVEYWISSWLKKSKTGTAFMSLSFAPVDKARAAKSSTKPAPADDDSDIPF